MKTKLIDFLLSGIIIFILICFSVFVIKIFVNDISKKLLGDYYVLSGALFFLLFYGLLSVVVIRLMLFFKPFQPGVYKMDDSLFARWKLFTVISELGRGALLPFTTVFTKPLIAKLFGAKVGKNIALGGHLVDYQLITLGDEVVVGQGSVITAHTINSGYIILNPVVIEAKATIGVHAVLMSGVFIGAGAIVTAGSVVIPNTLIPANELWGGVPAKKIKSINKEQSN